VQQVHTVMMCAYHGYCEYHVPLGRAIGTCLVVTVSDLRDALLGVGWLMTTKMRVG
jgi:hypothetical protein